MKKFIPQSIRNLYHLGCAVIANCYFGFPSKKIKVIGITGTNGKTTTTQMVTKILEKSGYAVAMCSTINFKINDREWVNDTKFTTRSAWQVQKFISQAVKNGCQYLVLETSSHSLDQNRVWGIAYDVAVITNVTREHLDYHATMDRYHQAKEVLFKNLTQWLKPGVKKIAVVNLDMEKADEYLRYPADEKYAYTIQQHKSDAATKIIAAQNLELGFEQTNFSVNGQDFKLNLIGQFNVENALAAISVGLSQKIDLEVASQALAEIKKVPGRMDEVENDLGLNIIIDYALTPDSMEKLGQLIKNINNQGKLIWVFGSCGDRDRGKRPLMGEIVASYADYVIVTNEDPYTEDPQQIIEEVFSGVAKKKQEKVNCWKVLDRKEAIQKAVSLAKSGDVILLTGKGAEETMAIGKQRIPWNDRQVVQAVLDETVTVKA